MLISFWIPVLHMCNLQIGIHDTLEGIHLSALGCSWMYNAACWCADLLPYADVTLVDRHPLAAGASS